MSEIVSAIAARHAEDEAAGPFAGRRSEQSRLDRGVLLAEIARLREERRWVPVGERFPAVQGDDVLTARGPWADGGYSIVRGWWNGECWMFYGADRDLPPVAFWQPLPLEPEGVA